MSNNLTTEPRLLSEARARLALSSLVDRGLTSARVWLMRDAVPLLLFLLMAGAVMGPVLPEMRSRIIGWLGDNVQYVYMTGWVAQALLLGRSPFEDPRLNYPDTLALSATDAPFLNMFVLAPVTWILGPTFTYNLIILLGFFLSGYLAYLWVREETNSRAGGLVAGTAFLLSPYAVAHAYGHLHMVLHYVLVLFFWALDHALCSSGPSRRDLLLLVGAVFLVGITSQYYLVMCLITGTAYVLIMVLPHLGYLFYHGWKLVVAVGLGSLLGALPYLSNLGQHVYAPYDLSNTRIWSLDPINFVLPSRLHPLWGSLVDQLRPEPLWIEKTLYIGWVTLLLATIAVFWCQPKGDKVGATAQRRRYLTWLAVAFVAAIFALGTDLHINNQPIQAADPFWLPAYYLTHLPFTSLMRSWARFGSITLLFAALLAGVGAQVLAGRLKPRRWLVPTICVALICIDLLPGSLETARLVPRPIDQWLARQPGDFAVAFLPPGNDTANYYAMFGSLFHAKHLPAYNHPNHLPRAYREFSQHAAPFPSPQSVEALRQMGLRYLLLERRRFDGQHWPDWHTIEAALAQSPHLQIVADIDGFVVVAFD